MIKPLEFTAQLAAKTGVEETTVRTIDKALVRANLRAKSQGRHAGEISLRDALRVALGVAGARQYTRADEDVRDMERYALLAHGVDTRAGSPSSLRDVLGLSLEEIEQRDLIDVLAGICEHIAAPWGSALWCLVWVRVDLGGPITIQVQHERFTGEITLIGPRTPHPGDMEFHRSATIGPRILAWIGHVTKGAAD